MAFPRKMILSLGRGDNLCMIRVEAIICLSRYCCLQRSTSAVAYTVYRPATPAGSLRAPDKNIQYECPTEINIARYRWEETINLID